MMMFAEEVPPVDPAPAVPPVDPAPVDPAPVADPAPADPATPPVDPAAPAEDPNKAKIDALQNTLDAALEKLSQPDDPEPAEPDPVPADPAAAPAAPPTPAPAPVADPTPAEPPKGDEAWKQEIKGIKDRQDSFETTTVKELDQMKLRDEMIGLTSEVQAAVGLYPNADPDKILFEIEAGSDLTVNQIAKDQHDAHQTLVDKIAKEQEEKFKTALDKENVGGVKVPQSSGTSSAPADTPNPVGPGYTKASQDAAWAAATKAAKANIQ